MPKGVEYSNRLISYLSGTPLPSETATASKFVALLSSVISTYNVGTDADCLNAEVKGAGLYRLEVTSWSASSIEPGIGTIDSASGIYITNNQQLLFDNNIADHYVTATGFMITTTGTDYATSADSSGVLYFNNFATAKYLDPSDRLRFSAGTLSAFEK
jgi:hypothetical protein